MFLETTESDSKKKNNYYIYGTITSTKIFTFIFIFQRFVYEYKPDI